MKIKFDIDTTPKELREFFGLPDVQPLQEEFMSKVREKVLAKVDDLDPASLMKSFLPEQMQVFETMQKAFWQSFAGESSREGGGQQPVGGK